MSASTLTHDIGHLSSRQSSATLLAPTSKLEWFVTFLTATVTGTVLVHRALTSGLLGDELMFVHAVDEGFIRSLMAAGSSHPPLIRLVVGAIADPASAPDWLLRLPCLICAVGCVFIWQRVLLRLIEPRLIRCMLLPAIALNPIWLGQAFQCLPYPPLVFVSSLHCLMWMRFIEQQNMKRAAAVIVTGSLLPWIHFYGINVLIAGEGIWFMLIWTRQVSLRQYVYINLAILLLTLPVVPLAVFYLVHDRPYPLLEIADYWSYCLPASSWCFWKLTFPGLQSEHPWFLLLYVAAAWFLLQCVASGRRANQRGNAEIIGQNSQVVALCFLLAGFSAIQLHSVVSQIAMWPRYMLAGSWIHLPVAVMLLIRFRFERSAWAMAAASAVLTVSPWGFISADASTGSDYADVAAHIRSSQQEHDGFLVQTMDFWRGANHFDQLWEERYGDLKMPLVCGSHRSRSSLNAFGLSLPQIPPDIQRVWVYSHLFKKNWLRAQQIDGWTLSELRDFGGPFPVALFTRCQDGADKGVESQQLQRLSSL